MAHIRAGMDANSSCNGLHSSWCMLFTHEAPLQCSSVCCEQVVLTIPYSCSACATVQQVSRDEPLFTPQGLSSVDRRRSLCRKEGGRASSQRKGRDCRG